MKKELLAVLLTIVGGVAVYWFTTGLQSERARQEQRQETQRRQEEEQQHAEAERQRRDEDVRAKQSRMSDLEMDINRAGSDYKDFVASDIEECLSACVREPQCHAITFTKSSRQCWMKSTVPLRAEDSSFISAVKVGG